MFLSLVRPDRISSPITSRAAVTTSWGVDEFAVVMGVRMLPALAAGHPYPAIAGYDASSHSPATSGPPSKISDRIGALPLIGSTIAIKSKAEHAGPPRCPHQRRCAPSPTRFPASSTNAPTTAACTTD